MALKGLSDKRKKQLRILLAVTMLISALCMAAYARYVKSARKVVNKLSPAASVQPNIDESFEDKVSIVKENVKIEVGNTRYPVYVRAALIFNWKRKDGDVLYFASPSNSKPEEGADYEISLNTNSWEYNSQDGFYYYKKPVESEGVTDVLVYKCTELRGFHDDIRNEDYTLDLEIITQTVQAVGHTDDSEYMAAEDAWNWTPPVKRGGE